MKGRGVCVLLFTSVAIAIGRPPDVSAADTLGSLLVESDPAGASVYVDGRLAGQTPLTLPTIAVGVHRVRLVRLGYLENSRLVTVNAGTRATVRARLTDPAPQAAQTAALKIVVLEGEGAVNIIQQKTAVAPVVEVRDRNDQPVAGAVVKFAIQKGRASFNGARTLTVTTNAAGRATATTLTPTGTGTLQIAASAAFQGQTAVTSIAQTTVMTAADASSIASGTGGASAGGGLSHAAIAAIVGGAGAGIAGALLAKRTTGPAITSRTLMGPFNGQLVMTTTTTDSAGGSSTSCASTRSISGTLTIRLDERSDGTVTGRGSTSGTETETAVTQAPFCSPNFGSVSFAFGGSITGTVGNIGFGQQTTATSTSPATVTVTNTLVFTGTLSNGVITGTMNYSEASSGQRSIGGINTTINGSGTTTFPVTLR